VIRPVVERPKQGIGSIKKTGHLPDISAIRQNMSKVDGEVKEVVVQIESTAVSVEELKLTWQKFIEKLKTEGREREFNIINQKVSFNEDLTVNLTLSNSFQAITIESLQQELLAFLRGTLKNSSIRLLVEIEKTEEKKMIYTNSEKYEYLSKKYPNLQALRKRFELDTDF
jgi:DNA polymerase III subunit gamma/tau